MDVSIVIVNWNTRDILQDCLTSVYEKAGPARFEVIVIDNGSSDGSASLVRNEFPQAILISNDSNRGFAAANNQGMAVAKGRYVLLLNSDTIILDDAVAKIVCFVDAHPEAAVVGCRVLNRDRTLRSTCFRFPSILNMTLSCMCLNRLFPQNRFFGRERMGSCDGDRVREVEVISGSCMLVRRAAIEKVGLMDEQFFMYAEETDWCYRFTKSGWKVMYTPDAEIIHLHGASGKQKKPELRLQLLGSILLFMKKHKRRIVYIFACVLVSLYLVLRVPYWLFRAAFFRENKGEAISVARAYLFGAFRAFTGAQGLCIQRQSVRTAKGKDVICFGGEDWSYHNRGHIDMQLMRRFARYGTTMYVNSIVMQKPKLNQGSKFIQKFTRKAKSIITGLKKSHTGFWVYSPFSLPVHHLAWARPLNEMLLRCQIRRVVDKLRLNDPIVWVACPVACETAIKMKKSLLVYQRTDRYEEYPNVDYDTIRKYDLKLKASADLTLFVSSLLYEEERSQCKKAFLLDHGVDYDVFAMAEQNPYKPEDMADIPKPIVGFFGAIDDHTSDISFLKKVIDLLPQMSFVFVGSASSDCSSLLSKSNVRMLGQKPYEQIPHYGKCFDVAIMPWKQNRWIEACNPIKLKEYLALGKPIVSTPFVELQKYRDVVYEAKTPKEFAECIKQVLAEDNAERITGRRKTVLNASWESKAQLVLEKLFGKDGDFQESD